MVQQKQTLLQLAYLLQTTVHYRLYYHEERVLSWVWVQCSCLFLVNLQQTAYLLLRYLPVFHVLVVLLCYVYVYHCDVRVLLFPFVELPFLSQWQFGHKSFELDLCIVDFLHLFLFDGVVFGFLKLIKGNGSVD